ncbi:MAG TPA: 50S ribosomal protein L9 [Nitriliruptorales bacterium]|nr:50S ribosomal protein L9 [Nitriliruptorales bacterium]
MKVILKQEVDDLGLPGDVVDVADGYGRNYLIPRGLALRATRGAMREAEHLTQARKAHEAKTLGTAQEFRRTLEARSLRIPVRVDEKGHLYGSVGASEVQKVLKERGHDIERRRIDLSRSIKEIGEYTVGIHLHPQVTAEVPIEVVDVEGNVTREGLEAARRSEREAASIQEVALAAADELEAEETADESQPDAAQRGTGPPATRLTSVRQTPRAGASPDSDISAVEHLRADRS